MTRSTGALLIALSSGGAACGVHYPVPADRAPDARFGRLAGTSVPPTKEALCSDWTGAVSLRDPFAETHVSFPETNPIAACFTEVTYDQQGPHPGEIPRGCAYPADADRVQLVRLAERLEAVSTHDRPDPLFPCDLAAPARRRAAAHDAAVLRRVARKTAPPAGWAYASIVVLGHGLPEQDDTAYAGFMPGDACPTLRDGDHRRLGAMGKRTERAALAMRANVAPVVIATGGAVHSHVVEAFAMYALLACNEPPGERIDDVIVEPCADHTHTNLRNAGRWLDAMSARAAYVVTDDWIQADYLQDWNGFELLLGSIDHRSRRDWGYVIGSWRQASSGMTAGFWFTPYRFWAEPREGLGSLTCVDR
jgi:hypothetical protein